MTDDDNFTEHSMLPLETEDYVRDDAELGLGVHVFLPQRQLICTECRAFIKWHQACQCEVCFMTVHRGCLKRAFKRDCVPWPELPSSLDHSDDDCSLPVLPSSSYSSNDDGNASPRTDSNPGTPGPSRPPNPPPPRPTRTSQPPPNESGEFSTDDSNSPPAESRSFSEMKLKTTECLKASGGWQSYSPRTIRKPITTSGRINVLRTLSRGALKGGDRDSVSLKKEEEEENGWRDAEDRDTESSAHTKSRTFTSAAGSFIKRAEDVSTTDVGLSNVGLHSNRLFIRTRFGEAKVNLQEEKRIKLAQRLDEALAKKQELMKREREATLDLEAKLEESRTKTQEATNTLKNVIENLVQTGHLLQAQVADMMEKQALQPQAPVANDSTLRAMSELALSLEEAVLGPRFLQAFQLTLEDQISKLKVDNQQLEKRITVINKQTQEIDEELKEKNQALNSLRQADLTVTVVQQQMKQNKLKFATEEGQACAKQFARIIGEKSKECYAFCDKKLGPTETDRFLYTLSLDRPDENKDTDDIKFNKSDSNRTETTPSVRCGTLNRLVERLAYDRYSDLNFLKAFLATYRNFCTPLELMEKLVLRYSLTPPVEAKLHSTALVHLRQNCQSVIQLRVLTALKFWMENYWHDFDEVLVGLFSEFLSLAAVNNQKVVETLQDLLTRRLSGAPLRTDSFYIKDPKKKHAEVKTSKTVRILNLDKDEHSITFLDLDPEMLAHQLTLFEYEMYQKIQTREFFQQSWNKEDKATKSPNILNMIHMFNKISNWVCAELVFENDFVKRTQKMQRFITLAEECKKLNNYNGTLEILAGLNNSAVHRLQKTWAQTEERYLRTYKALMELMENNHAKFRQELRTTCPPCIPYLGVFLTDLTFLEDGNPDYIEGRLINFNKMRQVAEKIREAKQYQNDVYDIPPIPAVQGYLQNIQMVDEQKIYDQSLRVETRKLNKFFG